MSETIGEIVVRRVRQGIEQGHKPEDVRDAVDRVFACVVLPLLSQTKCFECNESIPEYQCFRCLECPKFFCRKCAEQHFKLEAGIRDHLRGALDVERDGRRTAEALLDTVRRQRDSAMKQRDDYAEQQPKLVADTLENCRKAIFKLCDKLDAALTDREKGFTTEYVDGARRTIKNVRQWVEDGEPL